MWAQTDTGGTDSESSALSVHICRMPFRDHAKLAASREAGERNDAAFLYNPPERIRYGASRYLIHSNITHEHPLL